MYRLKLINKLEKKLEKINNKLRNRNDKIVNILKNFNKFRLIEKEIEIQKCYYQMENK